MKRSCRPKLLLSGLLIHLSLAALAAPVVADTETPRNIILMIADGGGYNQLEAADFWQDGQSGAQPYRLWPVRLAMATSPVGRHYDSHGFWNRPGFAEEEATDSAAAITAMTTGHKTFNKRLCVTPDGRTLTPLVEAMERSGRATGVVSSVFFSHATPAGCAVANAKRSRYEEIASDMISHTGLDLIMAPGHPLYGRDGSADADPMYRYVGGRETWQALLAGTAGGDADGDGLADPWHLVQTRDDFLALGRRPAGRRVLALAMVRRTLQQERPGDDQAPPFAVPPITTVPTLEEMTRGALKHMEQFADGFFLMIEGGAVDWAGHDNQLGRMIEEVIDFNNSVAAVVRWVEAHGGWEKNLVVITADHETGYLTGPLPREGKVPACRFRLPLQNRGQGRLPGHAWNSGHHTTSLVPLFARGPGSERLFEDIKGKDLRHGAFIDNTALGRLLVSFTH